MKAQPAVLGAILTLTLTASFSLLCTQLPTAGVAHAGDNAIVNDTGELERLPPVPGFDVQADHVSKLLYLNRCAGGCTIQPGVNDARFNTSSIPKATSNISPFPHGDQAWEELVQCVREIYEPYDVEITDVDPGQNVFHHEAIVAGHYTEIDYPRPAGGVAPSQCQPANNVISFSFATMFNSMRSLCAVVGQETAHSYGLEHAMDCSDPMTYLQSCGRQFFRNRGTPCGEFEERPCDCGGSVQNSHQWLTTVLGERQSGISSPELNVLQPAEGEMVQDGFLISATASHMRGIEAMSVWMNGTEYATFEGKANGASYSFSAPADLADGIIDVEVKVTNDIGTETVELVTVQKGAPCANDGACNEGQTCSDGRCSYPPATGQLGDDCASDVECASGLCPLEGETGFCSQSCFITNTENTCPENFECEDVGAGVNGVCWPAASSKTGGCGCNSSDDTKGAWLAIAFLLLAARGLRPRKTWLRLPRRRNRQR